MNEREKPKYLLGIDGGATKTEFCLIETSRIAEVRGACRTLGVGDDENGKMSENRTRAFPPAKRLKLEGCNPVDIGVERAEEVLRGGIEQICAEPEYAEIAVYAGISGGIAGRNREKLAEFFARFGFAAAANGSDAELIAAAGLGENGDGAAAIMGTGSVVFARKDGKLHRIGGYGPLFDNGGSGYSIGRDVIRAALTAEDGTGAPTDLRELAIEKLAERGEACATAIGNLSRFCALTKAEIADYAPLAFRAAERGDAAAKRILRRNMDETAKLLAAAGRIYDSAEAGSGAPIRAVFTGGLTNRRELFRLLRESLRQIDGSRSWQLEVLDAPPVLGALLLANGLI